jgi:hypothetical protein
MTPHEELRSIYEAIGEGTINVADVADRIDELDKIIYPLGTPLSFTAWCYETDIEGKYKNFHDEYGDAAALLSDYKEYHYQNYLERLKKNPATALFA